MIKASTSPGSWQSQLPKPVSPTGAEKEAEEGEKQTNANTQIWLEPRVQEFKIRQREPEVKAASAALLSMPGTCACVHVCVCIGVCALLSDLKAWKLPSLLRGDYPILTSRKGGQGKRKRKNKIVSQA